VIFLELFKLFKVDEIFGVGKAILYLTSGSFELWCAIF